MKNVTLHTDGACSGNPGIGGWAYVLNYKGNQKIGSSFELETTNNRMELTAVIQGLKALKQACNVAISSDSAYVVNAFLQDWVGAWQKNNWKNSQKKEVLNKDLWEELIQLTTFHNVTFIKVKGHADDELNNLCDRLAVSEVEKAKQSILKENNG